MEEISINATRNNVTLPAKRVDNSKSMHGKTVKDDKSENTANESGKKERINVDLQKAVQEVKEFARTFTTKLSFAVDPNSNEALIFVTEKETGKIIRQIPPEDILKMQDRMNEIVGILYNTGA